VTAEEWTGGAHYWWDDVPVTERPRCRCGHRPGNHGHRGFDRCRTCRSACIGWEPAERPIPG
jgi:hypothetical protein